MLFLLASVYTFKRVKNQKLIFGFWLIVVTQSSKSCNKFPKNIVHDYINQLTKFHEQMIFDLKDISKYEMHSYSQGNTNYEVTIFEVDGMIQKIENL